MSYRRALLPLALAATGSALLTACGTSAGGGDSKHADGRPQVVASFYPMRYLAEQIGGDRVHVTDLTAAGTEPHDLELTAKQVATVQRADAVLYLKGLQPTVDRAVAQSHSAHVLDAAALSPLVERGAGAEDGEDGEADQHEHEGDHEHGHDHAADPHLWLDPARYATVAQGVGAELAKADPANADTYRRNADDLTARLATLDQEYREGLHGCTQRSFVTSHAAFGYLADRYQLRQIAINGIDPESEPTPARMARIQQTAKAQGATTVFFEATAGPRLAQSVAKDLDLRTSVLDPLEGVRNGSGADYFSVMRQNLANLRPALGCAR
ncbi:metal ABC transporter substrate-binding protein [Kitasatospora sp. NBC_01266]|uniref:metal ABC transporter substrate-binding protein n=1 Tax=Kitasatospora sp. NBC_01266 TaxID=2903572 RepID=UPI002E381D8B|nr:zinc ABC transporter substrate-binding protein [Kitasatospora sp. NBC_01266]